MKTNQLIFKNFSTWHYSIRQATCELVYKEYLYILIIFRFNVHKNIHNIYDTFKLV